MVNADIYVYDSFEIEKALHRFRREVSKSHVLEDFRRHEAFVSKSERRKAKSGKARARQSEAIKKHLKNAEKRGDFRTTRVGPDAF